MKLTVLCLFLLLVALPVLGEGIRNTSYTSSEGDRVLRLELELPVSKREAWELFTTSAGWKKWAAPVVAMDFKIGGQILTNYDKTKSVGDPGTIRLPILNYIDYEMITLKVILNDSFAETLRHEDQNLQEIIQFFDAGKGRTRIVSSMVGWGKSDSWDRAYRFFEKGNEWTYQKLMEAVAGKR